MMHIEISDKLTGKYLTLAYDLIAAAALSVEETKGVDDGGTCNFDAVCLHLPRWHKAKVNAAAKAAGLGCYEWTTIGAGHFVFPLSGCGQGYRRTAAAEAMKEHLSTIGYEATVYYQMD